MAAEDASDELPIWRHPGLSFGGKLAAYVSWAILPFSRMSKLRYPEDSQEIEKIRSFLDKLSQRPYASHTRPSVWHTRTVSYKRDDGSQGTIYVHRPVAAGDQPLPLVYWMHMGGFTIGGAQDHYAMQLANLLLNKGTPAVWASVEYRLAPEHPFPAAVDDCIAGLAELLGSSGLASDLGFQADAVHVAGASAGGNLAAATMVEMLRRGVKVRSAFLDCPFLDPSCSLKSYAANARMEPDTRWLRWCWAVYLRDHPDGLSDPRCCPLQQADELAALPYLPPMICVTALADPLHDEGLRCVELLRTAGAAVTHVEARSPHVLWPTVDGAATERILGSWAELLRAGGGREAASRL